MDRKYVNQQSQNLQVYYLGPDYMANFIPGRNLSAASETNPLKIKLSITWRGIQPSAQLSQGEKSKPVIFKPG